MGPVSEKLVKECKERLLDTKSEILNRVKEARFNLDTNDDKGGDEADQTVRVLAEQEFLSMHDRLRSQLIEIESALAHRRRDCIAHFGRRPRAAQVGSLQTAAAQDLGHAGANGICARGQP